MLFLESRPEDVNKKVRSRILYLVQEFWGCAWYRCHVPGVELGKLGYTVVLEDFLPATFVEDNDVIVFQRTSVPYHYEAIRYANAQGRLTVYELDDDLWHLDPANPGSSYWSNPSNLKGAEECIRACQLVTTSTPYLARFLVHMNRNMVVLPNMLPLENWEVERASSEREKVVVGWAGGSSHWSDLLLLAGTVEQILEDYPQVEFHLAGMREYPFRPHERIKVLQSVSIEEYPHMLSQFDIGLAPLVDNQFNRAKSDLKFIEYGMAGVATIASKIECYEKSIIHGENGFLVQNTKDWLKHLRRLIEDSEFRKGIAKRAKEYAESRTIEKNIWMWEKAYGLK